ncbi:MAG: hypothetical protein IIA88_11720 [Bacteroidetes bacterium]|nr:hypothetical protein [Bacteroidota bacterium]
MIKLIIPSLAIFMLCSELHADINSSAIRGKEEVENISFYQVPLICGAAPNIGCGSRSKPLLLELMKSENIKEAWLNRNGTVVAVVWNETIISNKIRSETINSIFNNHDLEVDEIKKGKYKKQLQSFLTGDSWYKGTNVDELSVEESGVIAETIISKLILKGAKIDEFKGSMKKDIEALFKKELLTINSAQALNDPELYIRWEKEVIKIVEKYLGEGNMPELQFGSKLEVCENESRKSCCKNKKRSKPCCSRK